MPVKLSQEVTTAWGQEALWKWPAPSRAVSSSLALMTARHVQASSGCHGSGPAWHRPCSCWHGPVPGRNGHQCQAVMPSLPGGLLCHSRSGKWQKCKNCFSQLGSRHASTLNPGRLSAGCFQRLWPPCSMILAGSRSRDQFSAGPAL